MRKYNRDVLNGHRAFSSQSRCWPGGTPGQLLFPAEPIYFVQTPKEVWIIWQRQQEVRRIYLDAPHSVDPKPSWFGESVGHYENGELVVDTIGFLDKHEFDFVDNWRTPHTKDMHVVERFRLIDDGKGLEATITVECPGTLNQPWWGTVRWRVNRGPMLKSICAENNEAFEKYFVNHKRVSDATGENAGLLKRRLGAPPSKPKRWSGRLAVATKLRNPLASRESHDAGHRCRRLPVVGRGRRSAARPRADAVEFARHRSAHVGRAG